MKINWTTERRKIAKLQDYKTNPRKFTEKGMADLKASFESLGYIDPIAINKDGTIIGGHARKKTLIELGLTEIDVRVPDRQLTEEQVAEAIIRLNRNTAGQWDFKILEESFNQIDLLEWGFESSELKGFGNQGKTDPDAVPDLPSKPVSVAGDIWILGNHRLACGSSTDADAVAALLAGARPMLMVTDPPYGVNYDPTWREKHDNFKRHARGKVENDDRADWREAWALFPGNIAYVWHGGLHSSEVAESLESCGFKLRAQIIWTKQHFVFGRGDYHWMHEPCWYAVKGTGNWAGDRKQTTVWEIANNNPMGGNKKEKSLGHGTQKPVDCMKRPIENNSSPGQAVYEPFSGSGTTIIAAEITGRACYAMELSPAYVDMAIIRWQEFTGNKAVHINGKPFKQRAKA